MKAEKLAEILAEYSLFADCDEAELADMILRGHFVHLSQNDFGNFAGMPRAHINQQLSTWSEDDIVSVESGKVQILNHAVLSNIAHMNS